LADASTPAFHQPHIGVLQEIPDDERKPRARSVAPPADTLSDRSETTVGTEESGFGGLVVATEMPTVMESIPASTTKPTAAVARHANAKPAKAVRGGKTMLSGGGDGDGAKAPKMSAALRKQQAAAAVAAAAAADGTPRQRPTNNQLL
jgi:hypothetical protein